jgi:hypothetical protein
VSPTKKWIFAIYHMEKKQPTLFVTQSTLHSLSWFFFGFTTGIRPRLLVPSTFELVSTQLYMHSKTNQIALEKLHMRGIRTNPKTLEAVLSFTLPCTPQLTLCQVVSNIGEILSENVLLETKCLLLHIC